MGWYISLNFLRAITFIYLFFFQLVIQSITLSPGLYRQIYDAQNGRLFFFPQLDTTVNWCFWLNSIFEPKQNKSVFNNRNVSCPTPSQFSKSIWNLRKQLTITNNIASIRIILENYPLINIFVPIFCLSVQRYCHLYRFLHFFAKSTRQSENTWLLMYT